MVYGPGDPLHRLFPVVKRMDDGRPAILVAEPEAPPELDWARRVAEATGWRGRFVVLPREKTPPHLLIPGNAAQHWVASSRRIREELGYREGVALDEALRRTIAWERAHPPVPIDPRQFDYAAEDAALSA